MIRNHQDQISGVTDHKERSLYFVTRLLNVGTNGSCFANLLRNKHTVLI